MILRERVLRGGTYLILRQGLGLAISLVGVLLLTRLIGPTNYGLYAGSLGILLFLSSVARMGVDVYLIRQEGVLDDVVYHQAFGFLLVSGFGLGGLGFLASPLVVHWVGDPRFLAPLRVLLLALPLTVLSSPAVARLERALDYQKVAGLELVGQLLYYALALPLAWRGFGVWAPIAGFSLSQAWGVGASYGLARYLPRLFWSPNLLREMLGYGLGYSVSSWAFKLRTLVNPLIVGPYLGAEGVGYVALASRFVETLGFVNTASYRISVAALAKVQQDLTRMRRAVEEGMVLQVMALGPLLAGFALLAPWLVPRLFGDQWSPVLIVFPFIALRFLVGAMFTLHTSVLYVFRRNWAMIICNSVHTGLLAGAALLLVPRLGLVGYGWAEVATFVDLLLIHFYSARILRFSYTQARRWVLAFVPPLFFPLVHSPWGLVLWAFPLLLIFSGAARTQVREYWAYFREKGAPSVRKLRAFGRRPP
jgi:O-antigen/teichoic acid export membrane protein